ncbi:hypothetical protein [Bacillus toyonensis]|uniref:hypothetical protein n=1 Tax=Bacillus toyonensis TaxID=155322 RepID=UPI000BF3D885|nr:hypothetical protein [Bacillus toyonensis]PGF05042.1 hypothetical protein COM61_00990 [Bacillus toyonensis]
MKIAKSEVIKQVEELAKTNYKVGWLMKGVDGDFNKLTEPQQIMLANALGIKRVSVVNKKFTKYDGTSLTETEFLSLIDALCERNYKVAQLIKHNNNDYYQVGKHQRELINDALEVKVSIRKAITYENNV